MSCCCTKIFRLCDVNPCDDVLELPIPAAIDGVYTLELDILGKTISTTANQVAGPEMIFQVSNLNEAYTFTGQVRDPGGAVVTFTIDEIEYNCIEFTTKRSLAWNNTSQDSPSS
jgi:hypothetical protein